MKSEKQRLWVKEWISQLYVIEPGSRKKLSLALQPHERRALAIGISDIVRKAYMKGFNAGKTAKKKGERKNEAKL